MRLSVSINDGSPVRASLEGEGWLSAYINLSQSTNPDKVPNRAWIGAIDKSEEPNATHSTWECGAPEVGDRLLIEILSDGDIDPPAMVMHTSESAKNLFSNIEQARALLLAVKLCDDALMSVANNASTVEPPAEFLNIQRAIGDVLYELDCALITPTLRRHPTLLAEAEALKIR